MSSANVSRRRLKSKRKSVRDGSLKLKLGSSVSIESMRCRSMSSQQSRSQRRRRHLMQTSLTAYSISTRA